MGGEKQRSILEHETERLRLVREEGLAFELRIPGQPPIQIFLSGVVRGAPDGTAVVNWYPVQMHYLSEKEAAARAALTRPVTEAEVRTWHRALTGERDSSAVLDILAALRHFARAPGTVPSVDEIAKQMINEEVSPFDGLSDPVFKHARVAHDMMQRIGGGQLGVWAEISAERRNQDAQWGGVSHDDAHSPRDWASFIGRQMFWSYDGPTRENFIKAAALCVAAVESCDRLATTPAPTTDPDRRAKKLAWEHCVASGCGHEHSNAEAFWKYLFSFQGVQAFWRAAAKETTGE